MAGKNTAVFGIYRDRPQVERAVDTLIENGFRAEDISVLLPDNVGTKDFAHEKHTKAPEGATTGLVAGGVAGGTHAFAARVVETRGRTALSAPVMVAVAPTPAPTETETKASSIDASTSGPRSSVFDGMHAK